MPIELGCSKYLGFLVGPLADAAVNFKTPFEKFKRRAAYWLGCTWFHFISCLHAPSGAAHEGRKLLLLCQLASPTTHYACYFGRSQLPGPRPQAAAAAGPQQRPHPNPNQPEPTPPKATTPGRLRCVRGTQELRQNPNVTTTPPNGPPNTAP